MKSHLLRVLRAGIFTGAVAGLVLSAYAADETVTGNLTVEGDTDIQGDALSLGTRSDSSVTPGLSLLYDDATNPTIYFGATRELATWVWQSDVHAQFKVDGANTLTLFNPTTHVAGIVLNPAGTSTVAGGFTVNGVMSVPSGVFTGGSTGLTLEAGGAGDQDITLVPTGSGSTVTASPVVITSETPSATPETGALTVAGGAGIGGDVNVGGAVNVDAGEELVFNPALPSHASSVVHGIGGAVLNGPKFVVVSGNYAYVVGRNSNSLQIVDVSNPAAPIVKGAIVHGSGGALLSQPSSVAVSGNYAYVVSYGNTLEIINVSDPSAPVHVGSLTNGSGGAKLGTPYYIVVVGSYAYIASNGSNALEIVNISNPAAPVHAGSISDGAGGAKLATPSALTVVGNYAYVTSLGDDALEIVDISNPAAPVHVGSISNGGGAALDAPDAVAVSGGYAYVGSVVSNSFSVIDVSNPAAPVYKATLANGAGGAKLGNPYGLVLDGNYVYVASYSSNALEIVDVSNPLIPVHKGALSHGQGGALLSQPYIVAVAGNYAYVASYASNALEIISLRSPQPSGGYQLNGQSALSFMPSTSALVLGAGMPSANVGIGTNSPTAKLTVAGKSTSSADSVVNFTDSNAASLFFVNNAGNVGIGTTTPGAKLQVAGDIRVGANTTTNEIRFYGVTGDGPATFNHAVIAERLYSGSDRSELLFFKGNDIDGTSFGDRIRFDTPGSIVFQTGKDNRSYVPATEGNTVMTLNSAGRVLVGTTTDDGSNKLQISGNVKVNGVVRVPPAGDLLMGDFTAGSNPAE